MKFERIRSRFGSAHAIALLALFVGLFGTAYAATKINGKNLKNGSVPGKKLKKNTVTGTQVNESTLAGVNAAKLGGKVASDFQPSGDYQPGGSVIGGFGTPSEISQVMLAIPALGLQIETDGAATTLDQVVLRDLTGQSIIVISGTGAGEANTITGNGTSTLFANTGDFGGGAGGLEWLIVSEGNAAVIDCYFPDNGEVGFDYCQAVTTVS
jgi:hypothetical protein